MNRPDHIEADATVLAVLPDGKCKVEVKGVGRKIEAHLCGKMRLNYIKIVPGDLVRVKIFTVDPSKGRIVYRHKKS